MTDLDHLQHYELEGQEETMFESLWQFSLASKIHQGIVELAASEQGSRLSTMENAARNAEDMLVDMAIVYNKLRQTKITTEICEITSSKKL
eukprot:TRINITY_DN4645_c0_g1_i1.p1 TRINITY_DN4645_c0_g1~~TRINITY_DN4645_c0_g1_i1.p1  ORF type:complete len:107 (-),score=22.96 TRINITY_DN4645_c0_g1_i1:117-389(-)